MKNKYIQKKKTTDINTATGNLKGQAIQLQDNRPKSILQRKKMEEQNRDVVQQKQNNTGLPDNLKSGIENLSGHSMDDVKVHYNSSQPAQLNAHAFAQGNQIHLASGQEKHLPHEAWHVVQQKQGRVKPTAQLKSKVNINDDVALENEADVMGSKAMGVSNAPTTLFKTKGVFNASMQFHKPKSKAQKKKDAKKERKKQKKIRKKKTRKRARTTKQCPASSI